MIELKNIRFRWRRESPLVLDIPNFEVNAGERVFIEGPSGSGKSTLLNMLGGLTKPETGSVEVNGKDLGRMNSAKRDTFRADHLGIIFQMFNLIPHLSPIDNITLPCLFSRYRRTKARDKSNSIEGEARRLLAQLQINDEAIINTPAFELSIGQQQRVAAARSLIGAPELVIADEPTSALDYGVRETFMRLLLNEVVDAGSTLLFVSHDPKLADYFDRRIKLSDLNKVTDE